MKKTMLILLSFILSLTIVSSVTTQTASAADGDYAYSTSAKQALAYINKIRKEAGLKEVELDPYLTKAAENHANYLSINNTTGHDEVQGTKGFTGATLLARLKSITELSNFAGKTVLEGITHKVNTVEKGIDILMNAPYHREPFILEDLVSVGAGYVKENLVITYSAQYTNAVQGKFIYPYNGQKDVAVNFVGNEQPDPLAGTGIKRSGYIVTVTTTGSQKVTGVTFKDSKGNDVPYVVKSNPADKNGNIFNLIIPKEVLKAGTSYTVTASGLTSTFTTAGTTPTNPTTPPPTSGGSGVSGNYSGTNVGIKLDGSFISVNPTAKVVNGSTFIPLRGVLENMGASLTWDGKTQTVTIKKDATTIKLVIGSKTVHVNGKAQVLTVAPFLEKGYTFVPLRFISETFGAKVSWNAKEYIASIDTK